MFAGFKRIEPGIDIGVELGEECEMAVRLGRESGLLPGSALLLLSLRRLVAIELKLGSFDAAYEDHMELYMK